jgi:hypothetical protein
VLIQLVLVASQAVRLAAVGVDCLAAVLVVIASGMHALDGAVPILRAVEDHVAVCQEGAGGDQHRTAAGAAPRTEIDLRDRFEWNTRRVVDHHAFVAGRPARGRRRAVRVSVATGHAPAIGVAVIRLAIRIPGDAAHRDVAYAIVRTTGHRLGTAGAVLLADRGEMLAARHLGCARHGSEHDGDAHKAVERQRSTARGTPDPRIRERAGIFSERWRVVERMRCASHRVPPGHRADDHRAMSSGFDRSTRFPLSSTQDVEWLPGVAATALHMLTQEGLDSQLWRLVRRSKAL